jgi:NAD+ synthase (glutamine-hydrolysing)
VLIAIAQTRPRKGDYEMNVAAIGSILAQVARWPEPPRLVVFPETAVSGYFLQGGTRDAAVTAGTLFRDLAMQHQAAGAPPLDVAVGFYERFHDRVFNSALYATLGGGAPGIRHVHRKVFLPTYGLFDEERFVDAGASVQAFDTAWGRVAMLVCEDAWHSLPATIAALDGAQLLLVPSASPARGIAPHPGALPNNMEAWERVMCRLAEEHGVYLALAQLVGVEGGKVLQGRSLVVGPSGDVLAEAPPFEEAIVQVRLDRRLLRRARYDQPLLADLEVTLPALLRHALERQREPVRFDEPSAAPTPIVRPAPAALPVVAPKPAPDPVAIDPALVERWLVTFLKEEVTERRGFRKVLVALSGGVDSAVTAALAARAFGPANVIGVRLPYRTSSAESLDHAAEIATQLGITLETIDISGAVDGFYGDDAGADPTRRGNVMARMRMIALFDLSAKLKALPLGTGNKSERLLGYFTWHGDDAPPVNPLGDLYKTQVLALARHLELPDAVVRKAPTADLVAGQTDEADLGIAYERADRILHGLLTGYDAEELRALGFAPAEIQTVRKRREATHWKRQLPTVAMLSSTAIGESYLRPVDFGKQG